MANTALTSEQAAAVTSFAGVRNRLRAEHGNWRSGLAFAGALTRAVGEAVLALLPKDLSSGGWALAAAGSFGRGDLSPYSDVDLLVLLRGRDAATERLVSGLFYAVWDAGLEASPAVRTLSEAVDLAASDLTIQTSGLQARFLAGDERLFAEFRQRLLAGARRQGARPFLRALIEEKARRHERAAETLYGLEPDLKEGLGGLRDIHEVLWAGLVALEAGNLAGLARLGYLAPDEVESLEASWDFLLRVRHHLHYLAGRRTDRLYFPYQADMAGFLGYTAANGHSPVERLMRDLNGSADAIAHATSGFWEHVEDNLLRRAPRWSFLATPSRRLAGHRPAAGTVPDNGRLELPPGQPVPAEPDDALALFALAARRGLRLSHGLLGSLRARFAGHPPLPLWSTAGLESLLAVLRAGEAAVPLVEQLAYSGLLSLYLPEWEGIRHLAHHDVYHQHTVDRHAALTVGELNRCAAGRSAEGKLTASLAAEVVDFDLLLLAGLLHDIGKGRAGDHAKEGAAMAQAIGERAGLRQEQVANLRFLVEHHLLLARVATRRDLEDDALIRRLADEIADPDRLRMLYLLTVADSLATGPSAWSEWKAALLRQAFFRVLRALESGGRTPAVVERLEMARKQARLALATVTDAEPAESFLARMPAAYLLAQAPEAVREHFNLLRRPATGALRLSFGRAAGVAHDELTLATPDRPGLLWMVCGVFALHGVNIYEARVYTTADGTALDVFRLTDAFEAEISEEKRARIARDLEQALEGRLSLGYRLASKLRHYRSVKPLPARASRVVVDNTASDDFTVVDVRARDRLGLLYAVTRALSELQLNIHIAKVATHGAEAVDAFYVADRHGQKITDGGYIREIERAVLFALDGLDS